MLRICESDYTRRQSFIKKDRTTQEHVMRKLSLTVLLMAVAAVGFAEEAKGPSLVERLGFPPDAKLLILNGDDFGMNHATNVGTMDALKTGGLSSATIMIPCPWVPEVATWAKK